MGARVVEYLVAHTHHVFETVEVEVGLASAREQHGELLGELGILLGILCFALGGGFSRCENILHNITDGARRKCVLSIALTLLVDRAHAFTILYIYYSLYRTRPCQDTLLSLKKMLRRRQYQHVS